MMLTVPLNELLGQIKDGCLLGVPADYSGVPMAATRMLVQNGIRDLRLYCLPLSTLQADLLIGAGCVSSVETAAVTLGEFGLAPRFSDAVCNGQIHIKDSTCPALHAGLQATEKGVPFMPLRGLIGSDVLANRPDWRVINNPFAAENDNDPIVLLPAIALDITLFHAPMADREGNVWIGRRRELTTLVHGAKKTLVTVEEIYDGCFYDDEKLAAGVIPALYIDAISEVRQGAWPLALGDDYALDGEHMREYAALARTYDGFNEYLERYVFAPRAA